MDSKYLNKSKDYLSYALNKNYILYNRAIKRNLTKKLFNMFLNKE